MANFDISYKKTSFNEGFYSNDPDDTGGPTWRGIAYNKNPQWRGWKIFLKYFGGKFPNRISSENLSKIKKDTELENCVILFYKTNYWDKVWGDKIKNQSVADDMYDTAVNMGVYMSVKLSQRQFNLPENGIMDNKLLNKLNLVSNV